VNAATLDDAVRQTMSRVRAGRGFTLFTLNLDHLVKRREDASFRAAYARADIVTADGQPVVGLARRDGAELERTTGADLVLPLCAAAEAERVPVFLFGSSEESLDLARARLTARFPRLDVRGCESPPMGFDPRSEAALQAGRRIAASGARLCFVALGAPKQEIFADRMAHAAGGVGYVCIGAALDFISGGQTRAPVLFQRTGLEWAYRLLFNPARMWRRYARCALLYARLRLATAAPRGGLAHQQPHPA
jgi:exopolysaccharide biosynthesis WecB/TagA/CpsF family protein